MTTNTTTPEDANLTLQALEDHGTWASAAELSLSEETLHWLTQKLWVLRREVGVNPDGSPVWQFRVLWV